MPFPTAENTVIGQDQAWSSTSAVLYFGNIEGFGEWSILLSTRAHKDLRDFKRADGAIFQIIMNKLKWDFALDPNDRC